MKTFALHLPDGSTVSLDVDRAGGSADSGNLTDDVTDLLVAAGEAAADRDSGILLAIDEVQYLAEGELAALITAIHRTAQQQLPVILVGAGLPQLPGLARATPSHTPSGSSSSPTSGRSFRDAAAPAIRRRSWSEGVGITDRGARVIVRRPQGYPYFLQEWGYHAWNAADRSHHRRRTVERPGTGGARHLDANSSASASTA